MASTKIKTRQIDRLDTVEFATIATPSNPPSGGLYLYFKSDGKLYKKDSAGTETAIEGSSSGGTGGVPYTFNTMTSDMDPGNGVICYNNSTIASVTFLYIDNLDALGNTQTGWYDIWDDSTDTAKGFIQIQGSAAGSTTTNIFKITGSVTAASGYYKIPVTYVSGSLPANNAALAFIFVKTGDKGSSTRYITWSIPGASVLSAAEVQNSLVTIPYSGTISKWYLTSEDSATLTIDIWKNASAEPTNSDSITASAKPSLTAAKFNNSSTLTGWTTSITAGDKMKVEIESNDLSTGLVITLEIT